VKDETTFKEFFKSAKLNSNAKYITGSICGVKIEEIEEVVTRTFSELEEEIRDVEFLIDIKSKQVIFYDYRIWEHGRGNFKKVFDGISEEVKAIRHNYKEHHWETNNDGKNVR